MSVLSGYQKINRYIKQSGGYKKLSQWTSSQTVQMDDGHTLQTNLGNIKGITSSLATTNANYALSATAGKSLQDQITTLNNGFASLKSHVGMIIITTKLDTQAKVKNIYGGTTWTLISGRFLMGATTSDIGEIGGASSHSHISPIGFDPNFAYCWADASGNPLYGSSVNTGIRSTINMSNPTESGIGRYAMTTSESNLPPYKKVYIWERTA